MKTTEPRERGDLDGPEAQRERIDEPREERNSRDEEDGDLCRRRERDLARERDLSAVRDDDGAAVLGRVPDDRDDHRRDEELAEARLLREHLERADEDLRDESRRDRRDGQHAERCAQRPALDLLVGGDVQRVVSPQRVPRDADVDDQEHDRDRGGHLRQLVRVRVTVPPRYGGDEKEERREGDQPEREEARVAVEPPATSGHERGAEDEQEVPDHASRERAADDLGQPLVHRDQRDDELGRVAERRVEEASDSRAGVLRGVFGGLADQPRERDQRKRGENELERLRRMDEVVQRDRERRKREETRRELCVPRPEKATDRLRAAVRDASACRHCLKTARLSRLAADGER